MLSQVEGREWKAQLWWEGGQLWGRKLEGCSKRYCTEGRRARSISGTPGLSWEGRGEERMRTLGPVLEDAFRDGRIRPGARQTPRGSGICESPDVSGVCFKREMTH